jgi:quercetin dioxygenase-like cupin family protein
MMRTLVLATGLVLAVSGVVLAQEQKAQGVTVDAIKWGPAPAALPKGGQMAVLSGDPGKSGAFTVRLKMPAAYKIPAHQHPHNEAITVIFGEFSFGMGDKLDEKGAQKLGPGGFVDLPPNLNHFAFASVETVIQINTDGPFGIKYANPADDPSK